MLRAMRKWNLFTFWVYVLFGAVSVIAAVAGIILLFFAPPSALVALIIAAVFGLMSFSLKRGYDSVTR